MTNKENQIELISRGAERDFELEDLAFKLDKSIATGKPLIVKLGVDPTAPDIHLGHTVPLRKLLHFQQLGHEVVFLIGDFTGRIGDPSGRDKTRPPLTEEQILTNAQTYLDQISKILDTSKLKVVYNSHWLKDLNFGELIKMAANTTMSKILEHNTFRQRLDSSESIRLHELLYPFMQGFDSVALKADVELGGSDQTFNLAFGRDLQRFYNQEPQVCITMPILTGTDGVQKMSKSLGNYIGIDEPASVMFDKLMQMNDSNIINYFLLLTDVPLDEIKSIESKFEKGAETSFIVECKKRLAFEIIKTYHNEAMATEIVNSYGKLDKAGIPELIVNDLIENDGVLDVILLLKNQLGVESLNQARRLVAQGAVSHNGNKLSIELVRVPIQNGDIIKFGKTKSVKLLLSEDGIN
ncbi:MAG: tyrosine--tRNA ligase [Saprospiraceae bacterium]|nr:MAG: tyrosine--tRNA ligase [Saprospiraceae bacterium]